MPGRDFLRKPATGADDRAPSYLADTWKRANHAPGKDRAELAEPLGVGLRSWRAGRFPSTLAKPTSPAATTPNIATRIKDVIAQAMMMPPFEAGMVTPSTV